MGRRKEKNEATKTKKKGTIILIVILVIAILIAAVLFVMKVFHKGIEPVATEQKVEEKAPEKKLKIVDINSKSRPYAVMINNNHAAWPQCGLQDAYIVYELIAEGGITRMMAIYKDADTAKIGSIRSARDYFIDYAEENDAIFVHWGGSPQAYSRIASREINDIDGLALEGTTFYRDTSLNRSSEHTGFSSMEKLKSYAESKKYTRDTNKNLLLNYSVDELDLSTKQGIKIANKISIKYSDYQTTSYEYDATNKVYNRSMSGKKNVDLVTGKQYTAKNIIVYKVQNSAISDDEKGRQELENVGSGTGYYFTDGYAEEITWTKNSRGEQTVYKDKVTGEKIQVNDGNTFIQIYPEDGNLSFGE
jgi:hypothetical protein